MHAEIGPLLPTSGLQSQAIFGITGSRCLALRLQNESNYHEALQWSIPEKERSIHPTLLLSIFSRETNRYQTHGCAQRNGIVLAGSVCMFFWPCLNRRVVDRAKCPSRPVTECEEYKLDLKGATIFPFFVPHTMLDRVARYRGKSIYSLCGSYFNIFGWTQY